MDDLKTWINEDVNLGDILDFETIKKYVSENFEPSDIFSYSQLNDCL